MDLPTPDLHTKVIILGGLTDTAEKILKNKFRPTGCIFMSKNKIIVCWVISVHRLSLA
jgi:hypothetical protein